MFQGGTRSVLPRGLTLGCSLWLLTSACGGAPDDLREWRAEDHPAPPAAAGADRAAPPGAGAAASEAQVVAALWTARCARCHGEDGRGGGPEAPPGAPLPNFTDPTYQASRNDNALALAILKGRNMMPAFEGQLSAQQIALLVRHVRSFAAAAR